MAFKGKFRALFLTTTLLVGTSSAQEFRGRIQGNVTDSSQAAIAGATVVIVNTGTDVDNDD